MKKPKKPQKDPICGTCMSPINLIALLEHRKVDRQYVHPCGRILVRGANP